MDLAPIRFKLLKCASLSRICTVFTQRITVKATYKHFVRNKVCFHRLIYSPRKAAHEMETHLHVYTYNPKFHSSPLGIHANPFLSAKSKETFVNTRTTMEENFLDRSCSRVMLRKQKPEVSGEWNRSPNEEKSPLETFPL